MSGHVFVVRGDLRGLACDAWLLPTDGVFHVEPYWFRSGPDELGLVGTRTERGGWRIELGRSEPHRVSERVVAAPAREVGLKAPACRPWLVNIGRYAETPIQWHLAGVRAFVEAAIDEARRTARNWKRAKPLLALPGVGTGAGGKDATKFEILKPLLGLLAELARVHDVDLVLVTNTAQMFAMAQQARIDTFGDSLSKELLEASDRVAERARADELVPFLGAGVSIPSGLPSWSGLLEEVATKHSKRVEHGKPLAAATALESQFSTRAEFRAAIAASAGCATQPSLAHVMLAGITRQGAITTNYDRLFESALEAFDARPLSVLRHAPNGDARHWLLKLHGCTEQPGDIVITTEDYERYGERGALRGIVQAMLVTKHVLFAGFSLIDENFQLTADAVRQAIARPTQFGTALMLEVSSEQAAKWGGDLELVPIGEACEPLDVRARRLEIFLDRVLARADVTAAYFLDATYAGAHRAEERELATALHALTRFDQLLPESSAWQEVRQTLLRLGWKPS